MIDPGRYTSGRIAVANLSASIDSLEPKRFGLQTFEDHVALSNLLFLRGDLLSRTADHDQAELVAKNAIAFSPDIASTFYILAQLAQRFHRFVQANALLDQAFAAGYPGQEIDVARAGLLQATGRYSEALVLRERLATDEPGIQTLGALATLLAEMGQWPEAESCYASAIDLDEGTSPIPCSQLLFEWGLSAMRRGDLDRAEKIFVELDTIMPQHVPGRGHRAEVALARGEWDFAEALITPLLEISDDPEYRATYAEILVAQGDNEAAALEAECATMAYERLLARRPEAYAGHAAAFFMGTGNRCQLAVDLALADFKLRDTPLSRQLLDRVLHKAQQKFDSAGGSMSTKRVHAGGLKFFRRCGMRLVAALTWLSDLRNSTSLSWNYLNPRTPILSVLSNEIDQVGGTAIACSRAEALVNPRYPYIANRLFQIRGK